MLSIWQWSCHYRGLFLRLRSVATGDPTPISRMRGERSTSTPLLGTYYIYWILLEHITYIVYWFVHRLMGVHPTRSSLKMSLSLFHPITLVPLEPSKPQCAGSKRLRPTRFMTRSMSLATSSRSGFMVLLVAGKPIGLICLSDSYHKKNQDYHHHNSYDNWNF